MNKIAKKLGTLVLSLGCVLGIGMTANAASMQLNPPTTLNWGANYSCPYNTENGKLYGDNYLEYKFALPSSGKVAFACTIEDAGCAGTGMKMQILNASGGKVAESELDKGSGVASFDLLGGNYILHATPGFWTGCKFSMTPQFQASGETFSESAAAKNDDIANATQYQIGTAVNAQMAVNEKADVYAFTMHTDGFVTININSGLTGVNVGLTNAFGDIRYYEKNVAYGQKTLTYFVPAGTAYLTFEKNNATGLYSFKCTAGDIPKPVLRKASNPGRGCLKASWNRSEKVSGYEVQVAKDKKFKKGKKITTVMGAEKGEVIVSGLKYKSTYYARVRSYAADKNGKRYYSEWSNAKKVKLKKR